ncbi:uncharacterized protein LOC129762616 isoform X9 [Toxorhynchites rutilus septentrionalis]|uniref:uncharacterized protein LOC129762616 isoform X9 n=1 Tax=Toxorhynchites rutilus septentrionalis TaxID=329112 RepID=UPI00247AFE51|nr:uncharacterized protein LOC129762616 isoform X9 [Toxorhynchites rutilus septentrionalis]
MGTSNNPLDHPVLWSVQLKRAQEKRIADASLRDWQHRKQIERHARAKEQAHFPLFQYREVMERYSPWGRKGGGAPNDTIRIRNIQLQGLYPESKNPSSTQISHAARRQDFRNPVPMNRTKGVSAGGGGAPLRNASGQIVTGLTDDPIISFNDANRYHVDNELRYRTTPAQKQTYKAELDRIVHEKENRRKTRSSDADAKTNGGPWGKPGPGGKPWRPPKNVGQNFMKSMGWTTKETLHDLDIDVVTRMQRQLEEENKYLKKFSNCCSRNLHRSGDEYLHDLCYQMNQKQRKLETSQRIDYESSKHHFDTWSTFWGRPGHGAPLPHKNKLNLDNLLYATPR